MASGGGPWWSLGWGPSAGGPLGEAYGWGPLVEVSGGGPLMGPLVGAHCARRLFYLARGQLKYTQGGLDLRHLKALFQNFPGGIPHGPP